MIKTIISGAAPLLIIFMILKIMEQLETKFPILEQKWVEKVAILLFPIIWIGLGYGIYKLLG